MALSKKQRDEAEAISFETLCAMLPPGSTLYLIPQGSSASGMAHWFIPVIIRPDADMPDGLQFRYPAIHIKRVLHLRYKQGDTSVCMRGGGMDMAFALVNDLSVALYGKPGQINHKRI